MNPYKFVPEERRFDVKELIEMYENHTKRRCHFSPLEVFKIWEEHSDMHAAGWLGPSDAEEVVSVLNRADEY